MKGMHVNFNDINQRMPEIFKYLTGECINNDLYQTFKDLNKLSTCSLKNKIFAGFPKTLIVVKTPWEFQRSLNLISFRSLCR